MYGPRHFHDFGKPDSAWFIDNTGFNYEFKRDDHFYAVEEIKEIAQQAKQKMENRALKEILKGIVNETFEW